jgi:8-oxo-dGTP pyrophosphatase MutT (NUDIX family)
MKRFETPDGCAIREVAEEIGIDIRLVDDQEPPRAYEAAGVELLARPMAVQREYISRWVEHIDLVYVGVPTADAPRMKIQPLEISEARWFSLASMDENSVAANIQRLAPLALRLASTAAG